jgi:hypothetical protein
VPARIALLAAVVCLIGAARADALVVPQRSIKGVHLGWTKHQVRSKLGTPDRIVTRRNEITGRDVGYRYGLTEITFAANIDAVSAISTTSRRERTSRGIGVGSSATRVAARVPHVRCRREFGLHHCSVGVFRIGRTVTDFLLDHRARVKRITLGRVID